MKALITGITGQDGSYLAELLLDEGFEVHGVVRRSSTTNLQRINHLLDEPKIHLHEGDVQDSAMLSELIKEVQPNHVYNLAAQSHVGTSFRSPIYTMQVNGVGVLNLLEAIRVNCPTARFYQASTSEMFGEVAETPQTEETPFHPRSPYGCSKVYSYWQTVNYREAHGIFTCNGILFNHESPRRGENFVTRKITKGLNAIKAGKMDTLKLGNLNAKRDWGHAKDYVQAMYEMLLTDDPQDYVVASGETHSVRDFVEAAADALDMQIEWQGTGLDEKGVDADTGKVVIEVSEEFFRPAEVDLLLGNPAKIKNELGWQPEYSFKQLVAEMVEADNID